MHARFSALHQSEKPFLLPNAWDAASAKLFERSGASAIATSSAAVAWALGYPDGSALPEQELVAVVRRIARVLSVPLTVDIEDGYSDDAAKVSALVQRITDAGAIGINIEDGTGSPALLAEKIAGIRRVLLSTPLFINARTDVFLRGLASTGTATAMTIERLALYRDSGSDGVFVPGLVSLEDTHAIERAIRLPLNVMIVPNLPDANQLYAAGVRRISAGPSPFRVAYDAALNAIDAFMNGDFAPLGKPRLDFKTLNGMFAGHAV